MRDPDPSLPDPAALAWARLLVARALHDLGSPAGTAAGLLGFSAMPSADLLATAREAAETTTLRLRLFAAAWCHAAEPLDAAGLAELLSGSQAGSRVRFMFAGPFFAAPVPAAMVSLVLNAALVAAEALPRGGEVLISGTDRELVFQPAGKGAAWPPETIATFAGKAAEAIAAGPRRVLAPLLMAIAEEQGCSVTLMLGQGPEVMPLLVSRR
jgi:histidine phosphotransferase ChpT